MGKKWREWEVEKVRRDEKKWENCLVVVRGNGIPCRQSTLPIYWLLNVRVLMPV